MAKAAFASCFGSHENGRVLLKEATYAVVENTLKTKKLLLKRPDCLFPLLNIFPCSIANIQNN